ncbi:MAG: TonB-dependent receptor [Draconibacterium sp.]|nr:TonB-dependent receptor [Draconibacterium sp.]
MKKKQETVDPGGFQPVLTKLIRVMKLTTFLLFIAVAQVFAVKSYSQATRLSLDLQNETVKNVLLEIEDNSEFYFVYSNKLIDADRKVSIKMTNKKVDEILNQVFEGEDVVYAVMDRQIILSPKGMRIDDSGKITQQNKKITGTIIDESGQPLPGVTVLVKETTIGTVSDADGSFFLDIPSNAEILVFSFIGMKTQEVEIGTQTAFNIILVTESYGIEEIVTIGYGTVKKSDLTGAVGSVQGNEISRRSTTNVSQALQGAIAGVMVTRGNNAPGSTAQIRIRGITSIDDKGPLVIVDGVPVGSINDINPNDIQDISVLKDAASAAIYGARAASGVIIVTTKRAKAGELNLTYNAEFGLETATTLPEMVDVVRFMEFDNEMRWNDNGNKGTEYATFSKDIVDNYYSLNAENPDMYPNTDWMGLILKPYAPKQSHIISISAGTKAIKTKASIAYDKIDALYDGLSYERITARFNNDVTINDMLSTSLDFFFKRSISNQPSKDPMYFGLMSSPIYPAEWSDGRVAGGKQGANIYGQLKYGGFNDNLDNIIGGKASLNLTPLDGLKLSAVIAPSFGFNKGKKFIKAVPYYAADDPTVYMGTLQWATTTKLTENRNDNYQITTQFLANYLKLFGGHNINVLAGYENYYAFYERLGASRDEYQLTSFPYLNIGPLKFRDNSGSAYENAYRSWFGRILYNYNNKYFFQGNLRYDGSSRFHSNYRWGSFPSFSAGWVISEESFMQDVNSFSFLKLRGSWGKLGNERIGFYPYQATIAFSNALFYQGVDIVSEQTAAQIKYAIEDITWETTESFGFGVDAGFFNNRFRFVGDYFIKTTMDMLLPLEIPDYMGFDNPDQNTGRMETRGWEAEINWNDNAGDLKYSISFNISDFKSIMGYLGGTEFLGNQIKIEGSEFNEWYGYQSAGIFQTQEEVNNSPVPNNTVKPGDVKYIDISGPDGVPDGKISPEYDRTLLGGSLPRYLYGGNIRLDYKGFDFSMVIQGVGKVNDKLEGTMIRPLNQNWMNAQAIVDGNYWSHYSTPEQNLRAIYPRLSYSAAGNNYAMSDYWLFRGGYFRMKNITIGYKIPSNITQKIRMNGVRVYTSISDLFTINNYPKGWDPEVSSSGYPITTSYIFGVSVNF